MRKKHRVRLTADERAHLDGVVRAGSAPARQITRARVLLKADEGGDAWPDARIVEALDVSRPLVERVRAAYAAAGAAAAIARRPQPPRPAKRVLDGAAEARLAAIACSGPPAGRDRWTLSLLAGRLVELKHVGAVSEDTVRRALKKTRSSRG